MNKGELIEAVAEDVIISSALAGKALDSAIAAVTKSLSAYPFQTLSSCLPMQSQRPHQLIYPAQGRVKRNAF
ncbi:MAG: hypothetical protein JSV55_01615 [Deltaproteobacteria bacterium]|nr:MAG: hypothetical protein JSV55_01615 [Deltaproteobacteria bacterium]